MTWFQAFFRRIPVVENTLCFYTVLRYTLSRIYTPCVLWHVCGRVLIFTMMLNISFWLWFSLFGFCSTISLLVLFYKLVTLDELQVILYYC
jgi:hypothetical protein